MKAPFAFEIEEVAEVGEVALAGYAGGTTAVADDWDAHPRAWSKAIPTLEGLSGGV
jgi:hypothetical protein